MESNSPAARSLAGALLAAALVAPAPGRAGAAQLDRPHAPVVLSGAQLPTLAGTVAPDRLAAFRHDGAGWTQVPLQVDERHVVAFDDVYGPAHSLGSALTVLSYSDPGTFTGADPDSSFDADDELVLMAADAGLPAPAGTGEPAGVRSGTGLELTVTDPLDGATGTLYLFEHDGALDPAAGQDRVDYTFTLLAGSYLTAYDTAQGPNPEASTVTTADYVGLFSDRWIREDLAIFAGGATGVDLLDRHKFLFQPGTCSRTEETFSAGQGAFFANVDGPLRGIRSLMGANSGPLSQYDQFFYPSREDMISYIRVHPLPVAGMNLLDFSPQASGMQHANEHNPAGVAIDGAPDTLVATPSAWALTTGPQGTLHSASWIVSTITPLAVVDYYEDDLTPAQVQCTGDPYEYGAHGPWITSSTPNTDPMLGPAEQLEVHRVHCYEGPGGTPAGADLRSRQARNPLEVTVAAFAGCGPATAYCTAGVSASGCTALLSSAGAASATSPAGFTVTASGVEGQKQGLFYYGTSGAQGSPWGNGSSYQCVAPPVKRAGLLGGSGSSGACDGSASQDLNADWTAAPQKRPASGETVQLEFWYRDPQQTSNQPTSLSNALQFCVGP